MPKPLPIVKVFSKLLPDKGFEERSEQEFMAYHIETALKAGRPLLAEAGVGTGKTFAYLIPILLSHDWTSSLLRKTLIIATNTIVLQHQLIDDILDLSRVLDLKLDEDSVVLAKGQSHFLCKMRVTPDVEKQLSKELRNWIYSTSTGDRNEAPPCPDELWEKINVNETANCARCTYKTDCPYQTQKSLWLRAPIVVTNHQQLLADALHRDADPRTVLFSAPNVLVIDEAHRFEEAAIQMLGAAFTLSELRQLPDLVKSLEQQIRSGSSHWSVLNRLGPQLGQALKGSVHWPPENYEESGRAPIDINPPTAGIIQEYLAVLRSVERLMAMAVTERSLHSRLVRIMDRLPDALSALLDANGYIYWAQMSPRNTIDSLNTVSKDLSRKLDDLLWSTTKRVILTSATLTAFNDSDYNYWINSLGLPKPMKMRAVPSPFDFENNRLAYIPPLDLLPRHDSDDFPDFAMQEIFRLVTITEGRTLVLFTSHKDMADLASRLKDALPKHYRVFVQGQKQDSLLVDDFKKEEHSVLLGTAYWEGLDIPGPALTSVICFRLPFPPPDPILKHKEAEARKQGLDPFQSVYLTIMLMKLKQGLGRLIRSKDDYGVVTILDRRAHPGVTPYSHLISDLLAPSKITSDLNDVAVFLREHERRAGLHQLNNKRSRHARYVAGRP